MPRFDDAAARPPVSVMLGVEQDVDLDDDATIAGARTAASRKPASRTTGAGRAAKGRYRIDSELARGGMGAILRAFDQDVRRDIAMKVMLAEAPTKIAVARFLEEGQVTGQLEHPNIVPVYEVGLDAAQRLYFTMKMVRGQSLKQRVADARQDVADGRGDRSFTLMERVEVFRKICDGLAFAHSRGVIHRDLKPDNVMVGQFGEVQVMDWGLAKIIGRAETHGEELVVTDRSEDEDLGRTRAGAVAGTPAYMPPEQAAGKIDLIDERSDIYSLGAILYELLTFARPFTGTSVLDLLNQVKSGSLVPPAERIVNEFSDAPAARQPTERASRTSPRRGGATASARRGTNRLAELPSVPRELEAVVLKAMARRQRDRYQSVMELRGDVDAWLEGRTVGAADYTSWQLLSKWMARNKALVIGSAAVLLVAIIGLIGMFAVSAQKEAEARQSKIAEATTVFHDASSRWNAVADDPAHRFNPAAPHEWFQAALPPLMEMGRALQQHTDPPDEWREQVAERSALAQRHALETANWALALVLAESAGTWGAVDAAEGQRRLAMVDEQRDAVAAADRKRLDDALDRIRRATAGPGSGGQRMVPGEMEERARVLARNQRGFLTGHVLSLLQSDAKQSDGPAQSLDRRFLVSLLGQCGDAISSADGKTAPQLLARQIQQAVDDEERGRVDDVATMIMALAQLEAVSRGCVPGFDGLLRSVEAFFGPGPASVAVANAREYLRVSRDGGELPVRADNADRFDTQVRLLGDSLAASSKSGRRYTAALLDALAARKNDIPVFTFLVGQLGLHGDTLPPDESQPDRAAVPWLRKSLAAVPATMLDVRRPAGVADVTWQSHREGAAAMLLALARLGDYDLLGQLGTYSLGAGQGRLRDAVQLAGAILTAERDSGGGAEPTTAAGWLAVARLASTQRNSASVIFACTRALALDPRMVEAYHTRGRAYVVANEWEKALSDYNAAIAINPRATGTITLKGEVLRRMGRYDEALAAYAQVLAISPSDANALTYRARALDDLGRYDEALHDLDAVLAVEPNDFDALYTRTCVFQDLGRYDEALPLADRLVSVAPGDDLTWGIRGMLKLALGDPTGAIEDYGRAIELAPDNADLVSNRANARSELGDNEGARLDLEAFLAQHPGDPIAMNNLGLTLLNLGQPERARELLEAATPFLRPGDPEAAATVERTLAAGPRPIGSYQTDLATHHIKAGRFAAAEALARTATRRNPQLATGWSALGISRLRQEITDEETLAAFDRAIELDPENIAVYGWRSDARRLAGNLEGAIADADVQVASDDPEMQYSGYVNRGRVLEEKHDTDGAMADYTRAIDIDATTCVALEQRARVLGQVGRLEEALGDADAAVACKDADAGTWTDHGTTLQFLGRHDEAIRSFDRALELDPTADKANANRAYARHMTGDEPGALDDYNRALQLEPADLNAHYYRGVVLEALGRWREALDDYQFIIDQVPEHPDGHLGRGAIRLEHLDDPRGAAEDFAAALKVRPDMANTWHSLSVAHFQMNDLVAAMDDCNHALAVDSSNVGALLMRAMLHSGAGDMEAALRDYRHCREAHPDVQDAWSNETVVLLVLNRVAEAYSVSLQGIDAARRGPGATPGQWYNHACACGRLATARANGVDLPASAPQRDAAIDAGVAAFENAFSAGWNDRATADADTDLDGLRNDPRFRRILDRMR